ncbi:MAG TPA: sigma-70 family RNA polymerase sigma factor [Thermoanaerobaculia bacterium]|jgi:RNA polymerase sigma factor (TIGR02999 family)|nr:sigma-70 family RNA polymerase sigma factor [Thermoanaerobaculia bacterium]
MDPEDSGTAPNRGEVTGLLLAWNEGDKLAVERLMPLVYGELRAIAERHFRRERAGHTLQPTAVVHEAYFRLVDQTRVTWKNRGHFFAIASQAMRRILVDHARARETEKRGGGGRRVTLDVGVATPEPIDDMDFIALDEALTRLKNLDGAQAQIVELRFFGGLSIDETAEALDTSPSSVKREFRSAKAWLFRELGLG